MLPAVGSTFGQAEGVGELAPYTEDGADLAAGEQHHAQAYPSHALVVPPGGDALPEAVCVTVFLTGADETGGAPCVVPHTGGADGWARSVSAAAGGVANRSKAANAALYESERGLQFSTGSVLLHRLDTFVRETPVQSGQQLSFSCVLRNAATDWVQWETW